MISGPRQQRSPRAPVFPFHPIVLASSRLFSVAQWHGLVITQRGSKEEKEKLPRGDGLRRSTWNLPISPPLSDIARPKLNGATLPRQAGLISPTALDDKIMCLEVQRLPSRTGRIWPNQELRSDQSRASRAAGREHRWPTKQQGIEAQAPQLFVPPICYRFPWTEASGCLTPSD